MGSCSSDQLSIAPRPQLKQKIMYVHSITGSPEDSNYGISQSGKTTVLIDEQNKRILYKEDYYFEHQRMYEIVKFNKKFSKLNGDVQIKGDQYVCKVIGTYLNETDHKAKENAPRKVEGLISFKQLDSNNWVMTDVKLKQNGTDIETYFPQYFNSRKFTKKMDFKDPTFQIYVPHANTCSKCKNPLQQFYYWCYWSAQPNDIRCQKCALQKNQKNEFIYGHNSVVITNKTEKVLKFRLGNDLQPEDQSKAKPPQLKCTLCHNIPKQGPRFISLGTKPQPRKGKQLDDICLQCFNSYKKRTKQTCQAIPSTNDAFVVLLYQASTYDKY